MAMRTFSHSLRQQVRRPSRQVLLDCCATLLVPEPPDSGVMLLLPSNVGALRRIPHLCLQRQTCWRSALRGGTRHRPVEFCPMPCSFRWDLGWRWQSPCIFMHLPPCSALLARLQPLLWNLPSPTSASGEPLIDCFMFDMVSPSSPVLTAVACVLNRL